MDVAPSAFPSGFKISFFLAAQVDAGGFLLPDREHFVGACVTAKAADEACERLQEEVLVIQMFRARVATWWDSPPLLKINMEPESQLIFQIPILGFHVSFRECIKPKQPRSFDHYSGKMWVIWIDVILARESFVKGEWPNGFFTSKHVAFKQN